jgi:gamma-glutamylcyclotransferase (GGCT)/AIG2-like uncharacterized protein YtfP
MKKTVLFLYGTLKSGQSNHEKLAGQEFLGEATTLPLYRLFGLGWHPGLVQSEQGVEVQGELWQVDHATLKALDEYEGVPHWFIRQPIAIKDKVGDIEAYFYTQEPPTDAPSGSAWPFPA